jgi:hypothetical protein
MKIKVILGVVGIIILILGVYAGIHSMSSSAQASQTSGPIGMSHLSQTKPKSVGIPAIRVKGTASQVAPNTPRISKTDVENYVKIHPFQGGSAISGTTPKVVAINYITSKEASQLLKNDSIGLADTAMVYYVQWEGPFNTTNVDRPQGAIFPTSVSKGVEIFDAQTGNLLLWWIPNN